MKSLAILIMILTLLLLSKAGYGATRQALPLQPPPTTSKILIAVIDTGIDYNHKDLKPYLWKNSGETGLDRLGRDKSTNGIDDDGNGYIDDVYGWNFATQTKDTSDHHGHGTHIAGIITENQDPQNPTIEIMSLKYYDPKTTGIQNLRSSLDCLKYAIQMKAHIINYSGGGYEKNSEEDYLIRLAESRGILIVAAAGNDRTNIDQKGFYPASYRHSNIISVAALGTKNTLLGSSNFGSQSVHLAAPGKDVYSTLPGGLYGLMSGTSQATAAVTRALAQYKFKSKTQLKNFLALIQFDTHIRPITEIQKSLPRTAHQY